ncbi:unnamed protein product [Oppiella nova]|uniref:Uncharacterized protein n=1 Tax=Oppiella nova TaxID=334625 RepID=A0A7R9MMX1_9ACAR|nr:unnamed protein product [Oppiella nova]CAG2180146.1 unnamed protein product [Oppiella nova]
MVNGDAMLKMNPTLLSKSMTNSSSNHALTSTLTSTPPITANNTTTPLDNHNLLTREQLTSTPINNKYK